MGEQYTRRRTLKLGATAGAGLVAGLAGCGGNGNGNGNGTGSEASFSMVPADATVLARVEVRTLLDGPVVQQGVERALGLLAEQQPSYSGPTGYEEVLSTAEEVSGLDPRGLRTVTAYWGGPEETRTAAIMRTDWATADLVGALETMGTTLSEGSYGGQTLYTAETGQTALADLGDGQFVLGSASGVRSVVDVDAGEAESVSGAVVDAYERSPSGPVRFGADLSSLPTMSAPMSNAQSLWGGMGTDGDQRRFVVAMDAGSSEAAGQLVTQIETSLSQFQSQYSENPQFQQRFGDVVDLIEAVEVSQDGATVSISYSASASDSGAVGVLMAAVVASFVLGLGGQPDPAPQASFELDYDADAGTVTVTHQGGDSIPADDLIVLVGSDRRRWSDLSETLGPTDDVAAGNRVTVEMAPDEAVRVIYSGENTSTTLARFDGPDA